MKRLLTYIEKKRERQLTRKQLLDLPDDRLKDLAITRKEADKEARKFFWQ